MTNEREPRIGQEPTEDAEWHDVIAELRDMNGELDQLRRDIERAELAAHRCEHDEAW